MTNDLESNIVDLLVRATDGSITPSDLRVAQGELTNAGVDSGHLLAVIDLLETEYGLMLEPEEWLEALTSVGSIIDAIKAHGISHLTPEQMSSPS